MSLYHPNGVNELVSTQKPTADTGLEVVLHPLPLLEISDSITRSYLRQLKPSEYRGAVVGALLGQQNGRQITIEASFSCKNHKNDDGFFDLDKTWFAERLTQMKLVHKSPELDLVGWYSLAPKSGPLPLHLPIHKSITALNDSAVFLGFHLEDIISPIPGDPLPVTIYESNLEVDGDDKEMKDTENSTKMVLRFRKLPYTIETGEAEMIAMQFIREGGANATSSTPVPAIIDQFDKKIAVDDGKGKRRAVAANDTKGEEKIKQEPPVEAVTTKDANLTKIETEYMSALQTKSNALKMLKARLNLIIAYLTRLPPGFTSGNQTVAQAAEASRASGGQYTVPVNNILRHINALVTNIELGAPSEALQKEILQETNDVNLISMVSDLLTSVNQLRDAGRKAAVTERQRLANRKSGPGSSRGLGMGKDLL
ncbi:hypothetical protein QBC38DRAFT_481121 [Podospora fimiseda]|uniref:COP9 signalosome complex subunit 6 n=1 Tax=Podospora fimiseda TaxID=252190 RepID=A0AAN7BMQ3_9PEZI|nr:hypothetical protein QBC38DRAFT_481121 [Podospora fimiseda]